MLLFLYRTLATPEFTSHAGLFGTGLNVVAQITRQTIHGSGQAPTPVQPLIFNLGNGTGYSVQQVIEAAKAVTGRGLLAHVAPRRPGDPAQLVAGAALAQKELGWRPRYPDLATIIAHAWAWHLGGLQAGRG